LQEIAAIFLLAKAEDKLNVEVRFWWW